MRVLVAEDSALFREGLVRLLVDDGHTVRAVADAGELEAAVAEEVPDLVIADVRMPPTMTDDGAQAAGRLRAVHPALPILLLSQHVETRHAVDLVATGAFGYVLKDRVLHVDDFLDAVRRVGAGGSALDPVVVGALIRPSRVDDPLAALSAREREVLSLVAEGRSNTAVSAELVVAERTVETHMRSIFTKLGLVDSPDAHRRVQAVLAFLTR
ncbi:response regulator transcription factor [Spongisporangium articulatum]|uniref:Response regulator transcription factor n=1 Tax=Spongisporangium articulatum TaxID=3362603 RepID=A0ABW8ASI8_9ACTN